ncbi:DUF192 domain-containing protein [Candidatus Dojkabacteria bacterium]|nr:DUF192 domain-containing protein [Candidatus Dojkabacteria bacterium]
MILKQNLKGKNNYLLFLITVPILLAGTISLLLLPSNNVPEQKTIQQQSSILINKASFNITIADEAEEWSRGLMEIKNLSKNTGMLFIFPDENIRTFWMKNTYIPLDMIFMDSKLNIIKIHKNTIPLDTSVLYSSEKPSQYVLEINAGESASSNLQIGDVASLNIE